MYSKGTPPRLACCMINEQVQDVLVRSGLQPGRGNKLENVILYGGKDRDNVVIITLHGSVIPKVNHRIICKCRCLMQ
jgi:hypothetical protein